MYVIVRKKKELLNRPLSPIKRNSGVKRRPPRSRAVSSTPSNVPVKRNPSFIPRTEATRVPSTELLGDASVNILSRNSGLVAMFYLLVDMLYPDTCCCSVPSESPESDLDQLMQ